MPTTISSTDMKKRVLMLRLDGYSIRTVGEMVECCYQSIANFLRSLENSGKYGSRQMAPYHNLSKKEMENFCDACAMSDGTVEDVVRLGDLPKEKVLSALDYVTTRKPMPCRDSVYPKVAEWMRHNCVTMRIFADDIGVSQTFFRDLMSGREHMTMEVAEKINKYTNLPISDIFSEQIPKPRKKRGSKKIAEVKEKEDDTEGDGGFTYTKVGEDVPPEDDIVIPVMERERGNYQKPPMKKSVD